MGDAVVRLHPIMTGRSVAIFDLDGTLVDSAGDIVYSATRTIEAYGLAPLAGAQIAALIGRPAGEIFEAAGCEGNRVDDAVRDFRADLRIHLGQRSSVFEGVPELLAALQDTGVKIGVATTKPSDLAMVAVERADLVDLIDHVQGTDGIPPKPDPSVVHRCIEALGITNRDGYGVMVGDTPDDVRAGRSAGLAAVACLHGTREQVEIEASQPDLIVDSIAGLLDG